MPERKIIRRRKVHPRIKVIHTTSALDLETQMNAFLDTIMKEDNWNDGIVYNFSHDMLTVVVQWMETMGTSTYDATTGELLSEETKSGIVTADPARLVRP